MVELALPKNSKIKKGKKHQLSYKAKRVKKVNVYIIHLEEKGSQFMGTFLFITKNQKPIRQLKTSPNPESAGNGFIYRWCAGCNNNPGEITCNEFAYGAVFSNVYIY